MIEGENQHLLAQLNENQHPNNSFAPNNKTVTPVYTDLSSKSTKNPVQDLLGRHDTFGEQGNKKGKIF